jgi:four helix bundle protein
MSFAPFCLSVRTNGDVHSRSPWHCFPMGDFRTLLAWQEATTLACDLHAAFTVRRPNTYPGLRDQLLRAAGAVADNLAEGCARRSRLELARYADMAYASVKEVESQLERARRTRALTDQQFADFACRADRIARLCFGLAN